MPNWIGNLPAYDLLQAASCKVSEALLSGENKSLIAIIYNNNELSNRIRI